MAYDPTTPHSLLSRAETIAKHIGSVAVGLGHELMLDVERLIGLAPEPAVSGEAAALAAQNAALQAERGVDGAAPQPNSNPAIAALTKQLAAANEGIDSKTAEITAFRQQIDQLTVGLADKDTMIANLRGSVDNLSAQIAALKSPPDKTPAAVLADIPIEAAIPAVVVASVLAQAAVDTGLQAPIDAAPGVAPAEPVPAESPVT